MRSIQQDYPIGAPISEVWKAFEGDDKTTIVHMVYSGDILDEQKDIADWRDYYFDPIKKLLERQ